MGEEENINEQINYGIHEGAVREAINADNTKEIDVTGLPIEVFVEDIDTYSNEEYAKLRKGSLGASDSSIVLGVNPYKTVAQLIQEKSIDTLTEEEKAVGEKTAVRKGRDLEPLIIQKDKEYFKREIFKPSAMYRFKEFPWLTLNFDGVYETDGQYIPVEIKTVTMYGEKHYNLNKAFFNEFTGFGKPPANYSQSKTNPIEIKAGQYGIPAYYYTQLQVQMMALNAPYGYLSILCDKDWRFYSYIIYPDYDLWSHYITQSFKVWEKVVKLNPNKKVL